MPTLLLTTLILTALALAFAAAVVWWMLRSAVAESPESDPERDGGRPESAIAADADRSAAAVIRGDPSRVTSINPVNPVPTLTTVVTMRRVCCVCQLVIQEGNGPTTHGYCPACAAVAMSQLEADWQTMHPHTARLLRAATLQPLNR